MGGNEWHAGGGLDGVVRPLFLGLTITKSHSWSRGIRGSNSHSDMVRPMSMTVSSGRPFRGRTPPTYFPGLGRDGTESALSVYGGTTPDHRRLVLRATLLHERATLHRFVRSSLATVATAKSQVCTPTARRTQPGSGAQRSKKQHPSRMTAARGVGTSWFYNSLTAGTNPLPV